MRSLILVWVMAVVGVAGDVQLREWNWELEEGAAMPFDWNERFHVPDDEDGIVRILTKEQCEVTVRAMIHFRHGGEDGGVRVKLEWGREAELELGSVVLKEDINQLGMDVEIGFGGEAVEQFRLWDGCGMVYVRRLEGEKRRMSLVMARLIGEDGEPMNADYQSVLTSGQLGWVIFPESAKEMIGASLKESVENFQKAFEESEDNLMGCGIEVRYDLENDSPLLIPALSLSLSLVNIPAGEVLRYVCERYGVMYRIEGYDVVIYKE